MFERKPRRFNNTRRRPNVRGHSTHSNGHMQRSNSFSNGQGRNNFRPAQSAEKLHEKYTTLAQEAMSSGDTAARENYLQHADHFLRIIEEKNKFRDQNKSNVVDKNITDAKNITAAKNELDGSAETQSDVSTIKE
jgi:hypothetical protein